MAQSERIIGLASWLATPAGRYLLDWEQQHLDLAVAESLEQRLINIPSSATL